MTSGLQFLYDIWLAAARAVGISMYYNTQDITVFLIPFSLTVAELQDFVPFNSLGPIKKTKTSVLVCRNYFSRVRGKHHWSSKSSESFFALALNPVSVLLAYLGTF